MRLPARPFVTVTVSLALTTAWVALSLPPVQPGSAPADAGVVLRDYQPVTAERLKNPEADNWLMIRRTYDG
jgi:alcohol dehydrogenase (cytochrome c)